MRESNSEDMEDLGCEREGRARKGLRIIPGGFKNHFKPLLCFFEAVRLPQGQAVGRSRIGNKRLLWCPEDSLGASPDPAPRNPPYAPDL